MLADAAAGVSRRALYIPARQGPDICRLILMLPPLLLLPLVPLSMLPSRWCVRGAYTSVG
jgi:hypothetical protein